MDDARLDERLNCPIPTRELERRWAATRAAMAEARVDVLVMMASNDFMGGYPKWFTDLPATQGYADIVLFPRDAGMIVIGQGAFGHDRAVQADDPVRRGVARSMITPAYASAHYTQAYEAELAVTALTPFAGGTIGLLGLSTLSAHVADALRKAFSSATFTDASDLVDRIKAIKSADEIPVIRGVAAMQDRAMAAAFDAFRPGARDRDTTAAAEYLALREGSEQGLYMAASSPVGVGVQFKNRHFQNRVARAGDQLAILIENSGAGGYYCELGRTAVLGRATDAMHREFAFVLEARALMLSLLRPGAMPAVIWGEFNDFMAANGRPGEARLNAHSMGYDLVERPLIRYDEPMPLAANMVVSCHPTWFDADGLHWACDNFLIGETTTERLHGYPETITEIEA